MALKNVIVLDGETTTQLVGKDIDGSPYNPLNRLVSMHWFNLMVDMEDPEQLRAALEMIDQCRDSLVQTSVYHHVEVEVGATTNALQEALNKADMGVAHNAKFDIEWLIETGFDIPETWWCTMIGEYVFCRGQGGELSLKATAGRRGVTAKKSDLIDDLFNKGQGLGFHEMPLETVIEYAEADVISCAEVFLHQCLDLLEDENASLRNVIVLMNEMMMFLADVEGNGIKIDMDALLEVERDFLAEQEQLRKDLNRIVEEVMGDTPINLASGVDMTKVIYSREMVDRKLHAEVFNIGTDARGNAKYPPRMKKAEFAGAVRATTRVVYRTVAVCCPVCKGSGKIYKVKKNGERYKSPNNCQECKAAGAIYEPTGKVAGLKLSPESPRDATANGFAAGKDQIPRLLAQAENKKNLTAKVFLEKVMRLNAVSSYLSNFVNGIKNWTRPDGLLHTNFNQTIADTGRLSCVASWTKIKTRRGFLPITDVVVGDLVWTHERRWQPVEATIIKPIEEMYDVRFRSGHVLTCTAAHRLRLPNGEWKTLKEIVDERIEVVDAEPGECGGYAGGVPARPSDVHRGYSEDAWYYTPEHNAHSEATHGPRGISGEEGPAVLYLQDRGEEPYDREGGTGASQVQRRLAGSERVYDDRLRRAAPLHASSGNGAGSGLERPTGTHGRTSHRRRPNEQRPGQLSPVYEEGSFGDPLTTGYKLHGEIEAVHYRGPLQVYDLTVAVDHSYWAEGCFNHNSNRPNFQNVPKGAKFPVRRAIVSRWADIGGEVLEADFSGLEFRVAGELSLDTQIISDILNGKDIHKQTASIINECPVEMVDKEMRQGAKSRTFSPLYGGTGANEPDHIKKYFSEFFVIYKGLAAYQKILCDTAIKTGIIQTPDGRQYKFDNVKRFKGGRVSQQTKIVNYPVQGYATGTLVPLACVRARRKFKEIGLKSKLILTVHDSIVVDVYPGEKPQVVEALCWAMRRMPEEAHQRWGHKFTLPLAIEAESGVNWMTQSEVELPEAEPLQYGKEDFEDEICF